MVAFFSSTFSGEPYLCWQMPDDIRPKYGNLCFFLCTNIEIVIHLYCRILTSSTWSDNHSAKTRSHIASSEPAQLTVAGQVVCSLVSMAICPIRRQYPCPSSSQCFHQLLPCSSHFLSTASYNWMFQGCSIRSIQVVNNNYMYSQALPNSAHVCPLISSCHNSSWHMENVLMW